MDPQYLQQLKNISFYLRNLQDIAVNYSTNSSDISSQLSLIKKSIEGITNNLAVYESSITSQPWFQFIIGAIVTLVGAWFIEWLKAKRKRTQDMYFLQRIIVDQINSMIEIRSTVKTFLDEKIPTLLANIKNTPSTIYSVDNVFFPLFSVSPLPNEILDRESGSGYIDNKIGKIYQMSKDVPHIINDIRLQLKDTLDRNEKIAFGKLNPPSVQNSQFERNIKEFKNVFQVELLEKNIPVYIRKLTETLIAVEEKALLGNMKWKLKHDLRFKFYMKKSVYKKEREALNIMNKMDAYFKLKVDKKIEEIKNM